MKKLILILSVFLVISCASRKVAINKQEIKENIIEKKDSILQIDTKIVNNITTDEFIIEPIDINKPIFINNVPYKNAILRHKKVIDNSNIIINKKVSKTSNKEVKKDTYIKQKEVKKSYSLYNILWLLIPIIIFVIYKKKINIFA